MHRPRGETLTWHLGVAHLEGVASNVKDSIVNIGCSHQTPSSGSPECLQQEIKMLDEVEMH